MALDKVIDKLSHAGVVLHDDSAQGFVVDAHVGRRQGRKGIEEDVEAFLGHAIGERGMKDDQPVEGSRHCQSERPVPPEGDDARIVDGIVHVRDKRYPQLFGGA